MDLSLKKLIEDINAYSEIHYWRLCDYNFDAFKSDLVDGIVYGEDACWAKDTKEDGQKCIDNGLANANGHVECHHSGRLRKRTENLK